MLLHGIKVFHALECCVASCGKKLSNSGKSSFEKEKEDLTEADSLPHQAKRNGNSALSVAMIKQVNTDNYNRMQNEPVLLRIVSNLSHFVLTTTHYS